MPVVSLKTFRVSILVEIVCKDISAYDTEAAQRYAREALEEMRDQLQGDEVDLRFRDGIRRNAVFDLPENIDVDAEHTGGEEGDPEGTMAQADYNLRVKAMVRFDVEAAEGAAESTVLAIAQNLVKRRKGGMKVVFDTWCIGDDIRIVQPLRVSLVK